MHALKSSIPHNSFLFSLFFLYFEHARALRPEDKPSDRLKEYLRTLKLEEKMFELEKEETKISKKSIKTAPKKEPSFLELIYGTEEK